MNKKLFTILFLFSLVFTNFNLQNTFAITKYNAWEASKSSSVYIWLTEDEAKSKAREIWDIFRVIKRDGEDLLVTMDFRPWRINAIIEDDVVVSVKIEWKSLEGNYDIEEVKWNREESFSTGEYGKWQNSSNMWRVGILSSAYIGLTEDEAKSKARENWDIFRVIKRDGEDLLVTMDFRPWRINAVVKDSLVISISREWQNLENSARANFVESNKESISRNKGKFQKKIWNRLEKVSTDKLGELHLKIEKLIEDTFENSEITEERKNSMLSQFEALREIVENEIYKRGIE